MSIIDHLYNGLKEILNHDNQDWHEQVKYVNEIVENVLNACPQIEHTTVDGKLLFNYGNIFDSKIKTLLKCYRKLAVAVSYPDDSIYKRILPKINAIVETLDSATYELNPWESANPPIASVNALIEDLKLARRKDSNQVVCLFNDRGYKCKFKQVFKYEFQKVAEVEQRYNPLVSIYKNWCLYKAYDSIYVIDRLLLDGLISVCQKKIDVVRDEDECYGAIMSCLTLLDKFFFYYVKNQREVGKSQKTQYPGCITYLLELCIELMGVYMRCHEGKDMMRTAECHVNRARLNDRFYYHDLDMLMFSISVLCKERFDPLDPMVLKALYIYDMDYASSKMPLEFNENYDYRMSANMMHQHRQVAAVLSDEGDVFETSYPSMVAIGRSISDTIKDKSVFILESVLNTFGNFSNDIRRLIGELYHCNARSISHYVPEDPKLGMQERRKSKSLYESTFVDFDHLICFGYTHQIESYAKNGMVQARFIPIYFTLDYLLDKIRENTNDENLHVEYHESLEKTAITTNVAIVPDYDVDYYSQYGKPEVGCPKILRINVMHTKDGKIKALYCYGTNLRCVKHKIDWSHLFLGVPVSVESLYDDYLPETMLLLVDFFENSYLG